MSPADQPVVEFSLAPPKGGSPTLLRMDADVLSLQGDDGRTLLMLPRGEAAKYLRFDRDLLRGRVIEFRLLGGLRAMRFLCDRPTADAITSWLPVPAVPYFQARHALLILIAIIGLAMPALRPAGMFALVAASIAIVPARVNLSLGIAILSGIGALVSLFLPAYSTATEAAAISFLYGVVLGLVSLEHLANAGHNSIVLAARLAGNDEKNRHNSMLVRRVAFAAVGAAIAFVGVGTALYFASPGAVIAAGQLSDPVIFLTAAAALGVPVPWLLTRRRAPYGAALFLAQLLIAVVVLYAWGLGTGLLGGITLDYTRGVFNGTFSSARPYFVVPLLLLELTFRAAFVRAAAREAAEAD